MTWNYRVVRKENDFDGEEFGIHETYYEDDGETVKLVSERSIDPWGETLKELKENWLMMAGAFEKPVIAWDHAWDDEE